MLMFLLLILFLSLLLKVAYPSISYYWLTPWRIANALRRQGISGPKPQFFKGNLAEVSKLVSMSTSTDMDSINHDIVRRVLPHYALWTKIYGKRFVYWVGKEPRLCLTDTDLIKELLSSKHAKCFGKSWLQRENSKHFIGRGLLMANGESWHHQRHLVAPAFHADKLKSYVGYMVECTNQMLQWLRSNVESGATEVEINEHFNCLTADIISRTEFSTNYEKGKRIFALLTSLQRLCAQSSHKLYLPGSRIFPSKYNKEIKALKVEVERLLMEIIQSRKDGAEVGRSSSYGNDLLGMLLAETQKKRTDGFNVNLQLIMDECKTFFFAGHETTALLLTWTVMLLATNPSWQDKVRDELVQVCKGEDPSLDQLNKFVNLNMVINESLRLYPPASLLPRMAFEDTKLGDLEIPKGLSIWIPVLAVHHDKKLWGPDVHEFKPERFAGVGKSYAPGLNFMPFAAGPRNCIGQAFALVESKIILSMLIQRFSFTISPNYRHAPVTVLTVKPKHGVQVILKPLNS